MNTRPVLTALALVTLTLSSGCASIVTGHNQSLSVQTMADGKSVSGAQCKLENDKGAWYATSPGTVTVRRSYADLNVRCEKDDHEPGIVTAASATKGMAFGNILFGGFIGAAVDAGSGAAYDYPSIISVELGQRRHLDNRLQTQPDATDGADGTGDAGRQEQSGPLPPETLTPGTVPSDTAS